MFEKIIHYSIHHKLVIGLMVLGLCVWGTLSIRQIPIDAVPDITNNQVQIITTAPSLATQEIELLATAPIERAMSFLPDVTEIRSVSKFGLSVITIVFEEEVSPYLARQLISEQLTNVSQELPSSVEMPLLAPISTGLGEVYQYILHPKEGYEDQFDNMDLRTYNDWIVKRQLAGVPGVIEVSGWGGHLKQYEVAINPSVLKSMDISIIDVYKALEQNNENTGGSYIEKQYNTYFIRGEGLVTSLDDIGKIVVRTENNIPILIRDIAKVQFGSAPRYGAVTYNGKGEVVGGQALMLKGENSYKVVQAIKERVEQIKESLPEGIEMEVFIDRSDLIGRAIQTVRNNLIEGGLIVIFILVLLLGNIRGGLIVASVIPLSMLFAVGMMNLFGVSANLMSLGALDFGIIIDGAVIIVESIVHRLRVQFSGQSLSSSEMDEEVYKASSKIRKSAAFGELIILIVYIPILALTGIEGKMFTPMAQTVIFAIAGALLLSLTYVPMMSALLLKKNIINKVTFADRLIRMIGKIYQPILIWSLKKKAIILISTLLLFIGSVLTFQKLGGEFIPVLEEGDFAIHQILPPGSSLAQSIEVSTKIQSILTSQFTEVDMVVTKMGTAEIATDPMPIEVGDVMVKMHPKSEWKNGESKEEMFARMSKALSVIPGLNVEFSQPIQMRFNELMTGVREDIAVKIYGEDSKVLYEKGQQTEQLLKTIDGVGDIRLEQIQGLPQIVIRYNRNQIAKYGLNIHTISDVISAGFAGKKAGTVLEGEKQFDLTVRLDKPFRSDIEHVKEMTIPLPNGGQIPLKEVANIRLEEGPMQISRDNTQRRIVLGINARNIDTQTLVERIQKKLKEGLDLPVGYSLKIGGQFENLQQAKERLMIIVPLALATIFILLFITFHSFQQAVLIFTAIPLSAIGGVFALWLRDMPFSISAGIGFIALFGVAVLNGIVLIAQFNQLKKDGISNVKERIMKGTMVRLRPVLMTAAVAALGFLPMAMSNSSGGEVQKPLATVVIGGLLSATLLTLIILPILYHYSQKLRLKFGKKTSLIIGLIAFSSISFAQDSTEYISIQKAIDIATQQNPFIAAEKFKIDEAKELAKGAFSLTPLQINSSFGEMNGPWNDQQFQVKQSFSLPGVYQKKKDYLESNVQLSEASYQKSELMLKKEIYSSYYNYSFYSEKSRLLREFYEEYKKLEFAISKKFETGESGRIELNSMLLEIRNVQFSKDQVSNLLKKELSHFQRLIGKPVVPLDSVQLPVLISSSKSTDLNKELAIQQQFTELKKKEVEMIKRKALPKFSFQYQYQSVETISGYSAFQLGLAIPLFDFERKSKQKASLYQIAGSQKQTDNLRQILQQKIEQLLLDIKFQESILSFYDEEGKSLSQNLLQSSKKSYLNGSLDYFNYIKQLQIAYNGFIQKAEAIHQKNLLTIELNYLTGQF